MDDNGVFNIGKRNCLALRKVLWKAGLVAQAEETGGAIARTIRMEVGSGRVWMQPAGQPPQEMRPRRSAAQPKPA
jgi:chemotaxis protein CheD